MDQDRECRICQDGEDSGRLIKPCLCRGSISYVHVQCLQRWRTTSTNPTAFYACPNCHYHYRYARTQVYGLATNPVVVAAVSTIFFTILVFLSSFVTTTFLGFLEQGSTTDNYWFYTNYLNPIDALQDLVASTLSILDEEIGITNDQPVIPTFRGAKVISKPPGPIARLIKRFLIGLPLVGMASLVQLLSMPLLGPVQWLARFRRVRNRRESGRDTTTLLIVALLLIGTVRALVKVYDLTQRLAKRILLRAEDIILEVG